MVLKVAALQFLETCRTINNAMNLTLISIATLLYGGGASSQKPPVRLNEISIVSGGIHKVNEPISIGNIVFDYGLGFGGARAVFDLKKRFSSFVYAVGVADEAGEKEARYQILLDGDLVVDETMFKNLKPVKRVIDVRGKRTMTLRTDDGLALGEPSLSYEVIPPTKFSPSGEVSSSSKKKTGTSVETLIEDGVLKIRWAKHAKATCYAVTLLLKEGKSKDRVWSFTTGKLPELDVKQVQLPPGRYVCRIVGLTDGEILDDVVDSSEFVIPAR